VIERPLATGKQIFAIFRQRVDDLERAESHSGTRCSRRIFMRSDGTIHMRARRSISDRFACSTSDALEFAILTAARARCLPARAAYP
jgi:hypothetical protein